MHIDSPANGHIPGLGSRELAVLDHATRVLAEATSLEEITTIRNKAEAARTFAKAAQLGLDLQNRAAELRMRAERKAGKFLASLKLRGGDRKSKGRHAPLKLEELGISRDQSKRWQRIASVSEDDLCLYLKLTRENGHEVTSAGLLRSSHEALQLRRCKKHLSVAARSHSNGSGLPHAAGDSNVKVALAELTNHLQLLTQLLRPVYEDEDFEFKRAERRIIGRLLRDMRELLEQFSSK